MTTPKNEVELPPLKWFDTLSPDAQKVMLSLQRKYAKMREQILLAEMKKEIFSQDPSECYKSLYSKQFKAEPLTASNTESGESQRSDVNKGRSKSLLPKAHHYFSNSQTSSTFDKSIQIKEEPPDSPFVMKQDYRTNMRTVNLTGNWNASGNRSSVNQLLPTVKTSSDRNVIQTLRHTPNTYESGHLAQEHKKEMEKSRKRKMCESSCEGLNMSKCTHLSNTVSTRSDAYQNEKSKARIAHKSCVVSSQDLSQSMVCSLPETSFVLGFSMEECDIFPVPSVKISPGQDDSLVDFDKELLQASQDLFAATQELHNPVHQKQGNHTSEIKKSSRQNLQHLQEKEYHPAPSKDDLDDDTENHPEDLTSKQMLFVKDMVNLNNSHLVPENSKIKKVLFQRSTIPQHPSFGRQIQHINESLENENCSAVSNSPDIPSERQRFLGHYVALGEKGTASALCQSRLDSFLQRPPCSVSRKLEFNKKIRLAEEVKKQTNKGKTSQSETERKVPKFGKPKKSTPRTETNIDGRGNHDQDVSNFVETGLVEVANLSQTERHSVKEKLLQSQSICLTLVFANEMTLIRCFQPAGLQLKYVAIKLISAETKPETSKLDSPTFLFTSAAEDDSYVNWIRCLLMDLMENSHIQKTAMNAKQLCRALLTLTGETEKIGYMSWTIFDPLVGSWLLNSDKCLKCLQDVMQESGTRKTINVAQSGFRSLDSDLSLLHEMMTNMTKRLKSQGLWELFSKIETCLIPVLADLEMQKILIDTEKLMSFSDILKKKLKKLEEKAYASVGHSFCINSHPQLRQVLYEELRLDEKLPVKIKIAKTSVAQQKSTSEVTLTHLKDTHILPAIVLEYRQLQKLKSTYVDGMMSCVKNGYLSTHWDQTAAATGRLTSCQPNIQAIPKVPVTIKEYEDNFIIGKTNNKRTDIYAREPFICHEGHLLLAADFQQIELRLLAHLADDPVLLDIFNNKNVHDIFIELTSQWLTKPVSDVSLMEREQTKRIVYSVMYGVGKEKLADYLKVSPDNAKSIMTSFLVKFPAVNRFTKRCVDFCQQHGFTQTIFKRKRLIPHINHSSYQLRAQAGRQAVNFCVQGSAADLCKAAMLLIQEKLFRHSLTEKARLLAQIHDELLWEVDQEHLETVKDIVENVMEDSVALCGDMAHLNVPIRVTLSVGRSWAHLQNCQ